MFNRIFGGSDSEQLQFLEKRSLITIAAIVLAIIIPRASPLIALGMLFLWGWNVVKALFNIKDIADIFADNIVFGVVVFVFYTVVAYLAGIVFAILGVGRWIYLKIKYRKK